MKRLLAAMLAIFACVGSASAQCIHGPCSPCDLNGDGKLGFEDEELFFQQLAGNCGGGNCGCVDFNGDGDFGTDADVEDFLLCMEALVSPCFRAPNDFCNNATNLGTARGTFSLDTRYATGWPGMAPSGGTTPLMGNDVWYKWHCAFAGPTRVSTLALTLNPTAIAIYTGTTCPVTQVRQVASGQNTVDFNAVTTPGDYLIRIGAVGYNSTGVLGQFSVQSACPRSVSGTKSALYLLTGPGTGTNWSWRINSPTSTFVELSAINVPGASTTLAVAQHFAASINSVAAGRPCASTSNQVQAKAISIFGTVFLSITARESFELWVGAAPGPVGCKVGATLPRCNFNPDIEELPVSGLDCNDNGWDDTVDIVFSDSQDANQNGIPDECEFCGTADFDGDGDSGTDFDIQAFFACLGGTCCPTCGTSDFNGDGDAGTDLDIQSFFSVLGGSGCLY